MKKEGNQISYHEEWIDFLPLIKNYIPLYISCKSNKKVMKNVNCTYCIVASTSPSHFEAHADLFRSFMKGIFDAFVL